MNAEITTIRTLADCETVIERGLGTFVEVGVALFEICDRRLYLDENHETFEQYCRERWGMSRVHAHRTIEAAMVASMLPTGNAPASERVARELSKLNDQPTEQRETWAEAIETLRNEAYIPIIIASTDRKTRQDWLRCARLMRTELTRTIAFLERIDTADDDGGVVA